MFLFAALLFSLLNNPLIVNEAPQDQSLRVGPMHLRWDYHEEDITFRVTSPDQGWIVLGCNERDDIVGATLYMGGKAADGKAYFSERSVLGLGRHQSHETLGLPERVRKATAEETANGTVLTFTLPAQGRTAGEYDLQAGQEIWLIMAYSTSDDLDHHSRFRRHVRVRL